jgi:hypothetical protein
MPGHLVTYECGHPSYNLSKREFDRLNRKGRLPDGRVMENCPECKMRGPRNIPYDPTKPTPPR